MFELWQLWLLNTIESSTNIHFEAKDNILEGFKLHYGNSMAESWAHYQKYMLKSKQFADQFKKEFTKGRKSRTISQACIDTFNLANTQKQLANTHLACYKSSLDALLALQTSLAVSHSRRVIKKNGKILNAIGASIDTVDFLADIEEQKLIREELNMQLSEILGSTNTLTTQSADPEFDNEQLFDKMSSFFDSLESSSSDDYEDDFDLHLIVDSDYTQTNEDYEVEDTTQSFSSSSSTNKGTTQKTGLYPIDLK